MESPVEAPPDIGAAETVEGDSLVINKEPRTPTDSPVLRPRTPNGQNCPVCLGPIDNVSFTDTCAHEFCFDCLVQWSKVKPECPLCKRRFQVIMYNVKSAIDFSRLPVSEIVPERPEIDLSNLGLFSFSTTVVSSSNFRNTTREVVEIRRRLQQMISEIRQRSLEQMRIRLYSNRLKSVVPSNGRVREATPNFFRRYPAALHRIIPFLTRELRVLFQNNSDDISRMLNLVNRMLPRYPIMSEEFISAVRPFLGSRSKRFCQELLTFAKCPYDLAGFDRYAIYESDTPPIDVDAEPDPPNIAALIGSPEFNPNLGVRNSLLDSGSSSVSGGGASTSTAPPLPPPTYTIEISSDSSSESDSDSWIDMPLAQRFGLSNNEPSIPNEPPVPNSSTSNDNSNDSDCQIVGFDKPWEQRTPVSLTSESEQEDVDVGGDVKDEACDLRKRHHSSSESSCNADHPSPSVLAARGKRWSPQTLQAAATAAGSARSSFFPSLLSATSDANTPPDNNFHLSSSSPSDNEDFVDHRKQLRKRRARKKLYR